jgi:hypothetical protein
MPSSKAETVMGVQPTVVGMAALRSTVKHELDLSIGSAVHGVWGFWNQKKDGHHRGLRKKGESGGHHEHEKSSQIEFETQRRP